MFFWWMSDCEFKSLEGGKRREEWGSLGSDCWIILKRLYVDRVGSLSIVFVCFLDEIKFVV